MMSRGSTLWVLYTRHQFVALYDTTEGTCQSATFSPQEMPPPVHVASYPCAATLLWTTKYGEWLRSDDGSTRTVRRRQLTVSIPWLPGTPYPRTRCTHHQQQSRVARRKTYTLLYYRARLSLSSFPRGFVLETCHAATILAHQLV